MEKVKNVLIIVGCIIAVIITIAANIIAYRDNIPVWGWIVGDIIIAFVDVMFVKGIIHRFFSKKE